jgi:outer membrane protein insertion porin family
MKARFPTMRQMNLFWTAAISMNRRGRKMMRWTAIAWLFWVYAQNAAMAQMAPTEAVSAEGKIIRQVLIEGNTTVTTATIMGQVHSRPGAVFSEKIVSEDARRIASMPQITDVRWKVSIVEDQVELRFEVAESIPIAEVQFVGNKHIKEKKLLDAIQFKKGDFLDIYKVNRGREAVEKLYREKGYYFATVELNEDVLKKEHKVIYAIVEGPRARIKKIRFEGNDHYPTYKLKGKVKSAEYFPILKKGALDDEQLKQDCLSLEEFYHDEGFLDARIFSQSQFNEKKTRIVVTFTVEEGRQYRVAGIRFEGNETYSDDELLATLTLAPGDIFSLKRRTFAQKAITRHYGHYGYIFADVQLIPEYTETPGEVTALFKINEKGQFYLGRVIVRSNHQTQDKVVRRAFSRYGFLPGEIYDTQAQEKAEKRLKGEGTFQEINTMPIGSDPNMRDALIEVKEAQTGMVLVGVGVDTNNGVLGNFSIEQRNFDITRSPRSFRDLFSGNSWVGGGQRLRLDFMPGTEMTRGQIRFHEPYFFDTPFFFDWSLFVFRRWRESYLERRVGGNTSFGYRFENDWTVETTLRTENVNVSDLDEGYRIPGDASSGRVVIAPQDVQDVRGNNMVTGLGVDVGCDKTDDVFRPSKGYRLNMGYEQVGAAGGDFTFPSVHAGGTAYKTVYQDITERKTVLAGQIRGSHIFGDAPVFERYYAGGIGSLRGFDYRGVSPRAGRQDDPIGSNTLFLAGTELTHPIFEETLFGKLFCDSGIVEEGPYRVTIGFGLEVVVPQLFQMVPMHFDFGVPVFKDDKDDTEVFSFSFGMNF